MAQVVGKHKALSSDFSTAKKKLKMKFTYDLTISLIGVYLKQVKGELAKVFI
jgi:hypothetical protein